MWPQGSAAHQGFEPGTHHPHPTPTLCLAPSLVPRDLWVLRSQYLLSTPPEPEPGAVSALSSPGPCQRPNERCSSTIHVEASASTLNGNVFGGGAFTVVIQL